MRMSLRFTGLAVSLVAWVLAGCEKEALPLADPAPPVVSGAPSASASAPVEPKPIPTMVLQRFEVDSKEPLTLYPIEGAILVAEPRRVGRIVGDKVEWIGKIPEGGGAMGRHLIYDVTGKWPDGVDVFYHNENGRAPEPTYHPLTGEGRMQIFGAGGYGAYIVGTAEAGGSTLLISWDVLKNVRVWTARGPTLPHKLQTPQQAKCKPGEVTTNQWQPPPPAITPSAIGSTRSGVVVTVGDLCEKRGTAAEVFDKTGASRIVPLTDWFPAGEGYFPNSILRGTGDELFVTHSERNPILRFADGVFKPLPRLDKPWQNVFVSQIGQLHVSDGETIRRFEDGEWKAVARLAWPVRFAGMAIDGDTIWVESAETIWRLVEGPGVGYREGCPTPFVYLYDVSPLNDAKFTYPATTKAMSTFPGVDALSLEEFTEGGVKRLGIRVSGKEQGEAVIAHVRANMKDEAPRLVCFAPAGARKIPLKSKKKPGGK